MIFRKQIGWCVAQAYVLAGRRALAVRAVQEPGKLLPIVFHAAEPREVRAVLSWLRRANCLDRAVVTFDDGWRQFKDTVPVLEEFGKRAVLFIAPGETERGNIWTNGISVTMRQALYGLSESDRYARLSDRRQLAALLSPAEIRDLARHPLVRIGNHTWSHTSCTSRPVDEVLDEVRHAQEVLSDWCGYAPTDFAYPFGRGTDDLDKRIREMGLTPYYTRQGLVTQQFMGAARNMVYEGMSLAENLGRVLMAWPKVGETL